MRPQRAPKRPQYPADADPSWLPTANLSAHIVHRSRARRRHGIQLVSGAATAVIALLAGSAVAVADGGTSIATATPIQIGVIEYGNTVGGASLPNGPGWNDARVWSVNLTAGDQVTVTGSDTPPASGIQILFLPAGTTDADLAAGTLPSETFTGSTQGQWNSTEGGGTLGQLIAFTVASTGSYPIVVGGGNPDGPYDFEVTVKHTAILYASAPSTTPQAGKLSIYARDPDGNPITLPGLAVDLYGIWKDNPAVPASSHFITSAPVTNGTAELSYDLPAVTVQKTISLLAVASGADFQTAKTLHFSVTVLPSPPPGGTTLPPSVSSGIADAIRIAKQVRTQLSGPGVSPVLAGFASELLTLSGQLTTLPSKPTSSITPACSSAFNKASGQLQSADRAVEGQRKVLGGWTGLTLKQISSQTPALVKVVAELAALEAIDATCLSSV